MNKDKLNEAAGEDWCENVLDRVLKSTSKSAFKRGATWHESLPLPERLTDEEIVAIRQLYNRSDYSHKRDLESIFGKDLFTNKSN